jgi:ABC-type amino acid transport substrate-binding protein
MRLGELALAKSRCPRLARAGTQGNSGELKKETRGNLPSQGECGNSGELKRGREWSILLVSLSLCLLVLLSGCQGREGQRWEQIQASGVLRVGLDPTYPPFETADDGQLRGLDVDLARALAAELGLEAQFVYFGYDGLYDALLSNQVDVLISALVVAPERARDFAYSVPYFNAGLVLVTRDETGAPQTMEEMDGRTLAVELGSQGHVEATTWERRLAGMEVRPYNSPDEALAAVVDGEAEAALVDQVSGRLFRQERPGLIIAGEPITVEPYAVVVRAEEEILLDELNGALVNLQERGVLDEIIREWLDQ